MSYESAINKLSGKTLGTEASEMQQAGITPIILRWKMALPTSQNLYALEGCRTSTGENLKGEIEIYADVSHQHVVCFFPDRLRVGYAVVPETQRNLEVLAATLSPDTPWVIEQPAESIAKIKKLSVELRGTEVQAPKPASLFEMEEEPKKAPAKKGPAPRIAPEPTTLKDMVAPSPIKS